MRLESRYPYGRIAQQAQLETAYAHYKNEEQASAISAADRLLNFILTILMLTMLIILKG
jgi:outer membrane protein assembly factor BamD (BamD/ComL family)